MGLLFSEDILEESQHVIMRLFGRCFVVLERHPLAQASIVLRRWLFRRHVDDRAILGLSIAASDGRRRLRKIYWLLQIRAVEPVMRVRILDEADVRASLGEACGIVAARRRRYRIVGRAVQHEQWPLIQHLVVVVRGGAETIEHDVGGELQIGTSVRFLEARHAGIRERVFRRATHP